MWVDLCNLLERSGAELNFMNGREPYEERAKAGERTGAIVQVTWPRETVGRDEEARAALGKNTLIDPTPNTAVGSNR